MKNKKYYGDSENTSVSRKTVLYLVLIVALATIATIIIVAITASGGKIPVNPPIDIPIDKPEEKPVELLCPVAEYTIDKSFANDRLLYSTTLKLWETHEAIDLKAEKGTNVLAVLDGTITATGYNTLDGGFIVISHANGIESVYKSLAKEISLKVGDTVKRGDTIGKVSDTMLSEIKQGAHLHLEIIENGAKVNPMDMIPSLGSK